MEYNTIPIEPFEKFISENKIFNIIINPETNGFTVSSYDRDLENGCGKNYRYVHFYPFTKTINNIQHELHWFYAHSYDIGVIEWNRLVALIEQQFEKPLKELTRNYFLDFL